MRVEASAVTSRLELKVCERCGGLWLRPQASRWRYCATAGAASQRWIASRCLVRAPLPQRRVPNERAAKCFAAIA